jgi:polyisoprenoid-binding protein YceI
MKVIFFGLFLAGLNSTAVGQNSVGNSNAITFRIKNFGIAVEGSVSGLTGDIKFDPQNLADALFDVSVDAASIDTGISMRDKHLGKAEYLDVKNFPRMKFVSIVVVKADKPNLWLMTGELTIKGIAKKISFPFYVSRQDEINNFRGEFTINRRDFGVGGKSISMDDEILITLNVRN